MTFEAMLILLLLLQTASPSAIQATGQVPQDPAALTFEVSPDHDAQDAGGPRVVKYLIDFSPIDGQGTAKTVDLGKPAAPGGVIRVPLAPLQLAPGRYMAHVRVQGQTTTVVSSSVGPFQLGKPSRREREARAGARPAPPPPPTAASPADPEAPAAEGSGRARKVGFWRRLYGAIVGQ
jgi:hypothetical protein